MLRGKFAHFQKYINTLFDSVQLTMDKFMYAEFFILQNLKGDCCRNVCYFYTMKMDTGIFKYKFIC